MIVQVVQFVDLSKDTFSFYRKAVLLEEGETYSLWDPALENELAKNMTPAFVKYLRDKRFII